MSKKKNPDDQENTPEPFYHESENFVSAYFGEVPEEVVNSAPQKTDKKLIASLVSQLTDPRAREQKDEVLRLLKEGESQDLLVEIAGMKEYAGQRTALIAACWETGLDFSKHLLFFVDQAVKGDYDTCLEAMTVITENMAGPFSGEETQKAKELLAKVEGVNDGREALFAAIATHLQPAG